MATLMPFGQRIINIYHFVVNATNGYKYVKG